MVIIWSRRQEARCIWTNRWIYLRWPHKNGFWISAKISSDSHSTKWATDHRCFRIVSSKILLRRCRDGESSIHPNPNLSSNLIRFRFRCKDGMSGTDRTPCCESSKFPYPPHVFDKCLPQIISTLYGSPRYVFIPGIAGPKFARTFSSNALVDTNGTKAKSNAKSKLPVIKALVVEYDSSQSYTMSYTEIENFTNTVEHWFKTAMASAPVGMQNAWFISELNFYDLQQTLSRGTLTAIAIAMAASLVILLLVTLNIFISVFAVITVTLTILATIACLVLLGWKLNVLESIAVSTSIGLAVDFTLHFGVNYRLSPITDRTSAVRYSLSRMIGPTIMAAVTTGAAGAFMIPSSVLAYTQIGSFLVIVMSISWLYGTFFFASLLCLMGPQHNYGQIYLRGKKDNKNSKSQMEQNQRFSQQGTVSEQLLSASSSAAGEFIASESHELHSLNTNSIVKPICALETGPINFDRAFRSRFVYLHKEQSPSPASVHPHTNAYSHDDIDHVRPFHWLSISTAEFTQVFTHSNWNEEMGCVGFFYNFSSRTDFVWSLFLTFILFFLEQ